MKTVVVVDDKISGDVTKSRHQRSSAIPELDEIRLSIPRVEQAVISSLTDPIDQQVILHEITTSLTLTPAQGPLNITVPLSLVLATTD